MKKFYFSLVAAMMLSASTAAAQDGKTCETALNFPGFVSGATISGETWYTIKVPMLATFPGGVVPYSVAEITIFEGCNGNEAMRNTNDDNCYFLQPNIEYKMRIIPKDEEQFKGMLIMNGSPVSGAPAGAYCINPIVWPDNGFGGYAAIKQKPGTTVWYQREIPYNGNLKIEKAPYVSYTANEAKPIRIEVKRSDCNGVSSVGEALTINDMYMAAPSPYAKAGTNLISVRFDKGDDESVTETQIYISQDVISTLDCNNRPERMPAIELDKETGVQNGYYVKDYKFVPTTSGTHTFKFNAAEGTVINVGTVEFTGEYRYPDDQTGPIYECRYEIHNPVIVNSSNMTEFTINLEAGKEYVLHYDSDYALEGGTPSMKVLEGDQTSINSIEMNKKTDVMVSENPTDGNFTVSSYLLPDCGEIALYDMGANKVFSTKSQGGKEQNIQLTGVKSGVYLLVVYGRGRSACTKLIVK